MSPFRFEREGKPKMPRGHVLLGLVIVSWIIFALIVIGLAAASN
jgi:hypothetical protein